MLHTCSLHHQHFPLPTCTRPHKCRNRDESTIFFFLKQNKGKENKLFFPLPGFFSLRLKPICNCISFFSLSNCFPFYCFFIFFRMFDSSFVHDLYIEKLYSFFKFVIICSRFVWHFHVQIETNGYILLTHNLCRPPIGRSVTNNRSFKLLSDIYCILSL